MEWWQIILIVLASIVVGMLSAALTSYLVKRFARMREASLLTKQQVEPAAPELKPAATELEPAAAEPKPAAAELEPAATELEPAAPEVKPAAPEVKPAAPEPIPAAAGLKYTVPDLVKEIEDNLKIATEPWTGELLPFKAAAWNAIQNEVNKLHENIRDELAQVYIDIRLANSIVRLSTQFSHRSRDLNENYKKLCTSIAERLNKIKPLIESPEK